MADRGQPVSDQEIVEPFGDAAALDDRRVGLGSRSNTSANGGWAVRMIDELDGKHGFDALDHTEQSRQAVIETTDLVVENLLRGTTGCPGPRTFVQSIVDRGTKWLSR